MLVIGSQCQELNHLFFLPAVAEELYAVLTTPDLGGCVPALPDSVGLLLDPTVVETREALETAFERASTDEATRLLVYVGHGGYGRGTDFYLLLLDAPAFYTTPLVAQKLTAALDYLR